MPCRSAAARSLALKTVQIIWRQQDHHRAAGQRLLFIAGLLLHAFRRRIDDVSSPPALQQQSPGGIYVAAQRSRTILAGSTAVSAKRRGLQAPVIMTSSCRIARRRCAAGLLPVSFGQPATVFFSKISNVSSSRCSLSDNLPAPCLNALGSGTQFQRVCHRATLIRVTRFAIWREFEQLPAQDIPQSWYFNHVPASFAIVEGKYCPRAQKIFSG